MSGKNTTQNLQRRSTERGAVFAETALVTPVLVLILFYLVQGVYLSQAYLSVTHIAREATLLASTLKNASSTTTPYSNLDPTESAVQVCLAATIPTADCAHLVAHWRIRRLLESNRLKVSDFNFSSNRQTAGMQVQITGAPSMVVPMVSATLIKANAKAQYVGQ